MFGSLGLAVTTGCRLIALFLLLLVVGCGSEPPPLLRLGVIPWPGYAPLHLAADLGQYPAGIRLRLIDYAASTGVLRAFRNGSLEAAALTLDEALLLAEDLPDLRVVLVLDSSLGADVLLGRPGIAKLADLRGRRVGYESTALGAYMLGRALETAGLRAEEVTLVSLQLDQHENALTNGQVDAVVTFEPNRSRLLASGAWVLFSSAQIPGEILDVLVVRQAFLEQHPGAVAALAQGWLKALAYQQQSPGDAVRRLGAELRLTPAQTRDAYQLLALADLTENRRLLAGNPPALRAVAERLGAVMLRQHLLRRPPALDQLFVAGAPSLPVP